MSDHTTTALAVLASSTDIERVSATLAKSGPMLPKHLQSGGPSAVFAVLLTGAELGMSPMQAIRSLHIVEGRVVIDAAAQLALAIQRGIRCVWEQTSATQATCRLTRSGDPDGYTSTWTIAMAERAGLAKRPTWVAHPEAMLRARAITAGIRAYCPDVLGGVAYSSDELQDADRPPAPATPIPVVATVVQTVPEPAPEARRWGAVTWEEVVEILHAEGIDAGRVDVARAERGDTALEQDSDEGRAEWLTRALGNPRTVAAMRARCGIGGAS